MQAACFDGRSLSATPFSCGVSSVAKSCRMPLSLRIFLNVPQLNSPSSSDRTHSTADGVVLPRRNANVVSASDFWFRKYAKLGREKSCPSSAYSRAHLRRTWWAQTIPHTPFCEGRPERERVFFDLTVGAKSVVELSRSSAGNESSRLRTDRS